MREVRTALCKMCRLEKQNVVKTSPDGIPVNKINTLLKQKKVGKNLFSNVLGFTRYLSDKVGMTD